MKITEPEGYGNHRQPSRMFQVGGCSESTPSCVVNAGRDEKDVFEITMLERVAYAKKKVKSRRVEARVGSGDLHATAIALPRYLGIQRQM
jgi:hypothetical protein